MAAASNLADLVSTFTGINGLVKSTGTGLPSLAVSGTDYLVPNSNYGTPIGIVLTNATNMPISGITGLGTNVPSFLTVPTSANLFTALTTKTGTGTVVFDTNANITAPTLNQAVNLFGTTIAATAAGTTQATATAITTEYTNFSTVAAGTGAVLPVSALGRCFTVKNSGANNLLVYPPSTGIIDSNAANAGYIVPIGATEVFLFTNTVNSATLEGRQTPLNVANTVVQRDGSGNFAANAITIASISGMTTALSVAQGGTGVITGTGTGSNVLNTSPAITTPSITATREIYAALGSSAITLASGNYFSFTSTAATTWTVTGTPAAGTVQSFILELTNGGAFTQTWPTNSKWAGGTAPALTAAGLDIIGGYSRDAGATWRMFLIAKDSK